MEGAKKMDQKPAYDPLPPSSPPPSARDRRTLLVRRGRPAPKPRAARFAECAGSTTAGCAALFCCCPCGLAHLLFVAAVKLPAGLLRRALRRRRKGNLKRGRRTAGARKPSTFAVDDEDVYDDLSIHPGSLLPTVSSEEVLWLARTSLAADDFAELEKEIMSASFYGAGFWRSLSQVHVEN